MQLKWDLKENKAFEDKINDLTDSQVLSQILANRGIDTFEKAKLFLNPLEYPVSSPYNFTDIQKATERIAEAIEKQQNIVICGDFDCDGVTSSTVLYKTLVETGAKVCCYIPDRQTENHGLNTKAIVEIISKRQAKLIITVDNGISNAAEIRLAKSFGTDVIITDHHEPPEELPPAYAIINPKCVDKLSDKLEFKEIENMTGFAGVMVAYKLCCSLLKHFHKEDFKKELIPYVALGTISDVMPLINENRLMVAKGLEILNNQKPAWLIKLFELAEKSHDNLTSEMLAFIVAPRINAAGRLEKATTALELLVSDKEEQINFCANQLTQFNLSRQQMCDTSFKEAVVRIQNEINLKTTKAIVLADEKWHIGIVGLLASKIVETYNRPAFIMNINKEENIARCSIRGIKGLNIHKVLTQMEEYFINYGGHELAGGFGVDLSRYSVKDVANRINKIVLSELEGNNLEHKISIDMILKPEDLTLDLIEKLVLLEPYGEGNHSCIFGMENMVLKRLDTIGNTNSHLKMIFESENGIQFEGLIWNKSSHPIELLDKVDLTFVPKINTFRNKKIVQLIIKNIFIKNREIAKPDTDFDENEKIQAILVDHRKKNDFFKMLNSYLSNNQANVFLENKIIENAISDYSYIKSKIKNRFNLTANDELIFLTTPCNEEEFSEIIKTVLPKKVHIFNCNDQKIDVNEFLKTISGMLKYCEKHNNGQIEIEKSLAFLSTTKEAFFEALELLNNCNVIHINKINDDSVEFSFLHSEALSELVHNTKYIELSQEIEKINNFKEEFNSCDIVQIKDMIEL